MGTMVGFGCAYLTNGLLFIIFINLYRPSFLCYIVFSYICTFKRFSFCSPSGDLHSVCPIHRAALLLSYRWTNPCHTNSTVVRTVIELVCTCGILNMALYSLLNIFKLVLATFQPRGSPLGLDHSPKPITVDFVKLCGLRIVSISSNLFNSFNIY